MMQLHSTCANAAMALKKDPCEVDVCIVIEFSVLPTPAITAFYNNPNVTLIIQPSALPVCTAAAH